MEILNEALAQFSEDKARVDIQLREAGLNGFDCCEFFKDRPRCQVLEISGDFSWSDFTAGIFRAPEPYLSKKAIALTGWFIGADFKECRFNRTELSGDFAHAKFDGAHLHECKLSGIFHRARLGVDLSSCDISAEAEFQGADLRGGKGVFHSEKQLHGARIGSDDRIVVRTGAKISILGEEYGLCRISQWSKSIYTGADGGG